MKKIATVIIGGGQAGLATSYHLKKNNHEHVVLEQSDQAASAWSNRSWDSFSLVTPNSAFRMPGEILSHLNRDGFMSRNEVVDFFESYINKYDLPVEYESRVWHVERSGHDSFIVRTDELPWEATNVVIATGFFQQPKVPSFAGKLSDEIKQLHSSEYRNPRSLPEGKILVVGSGQSGAQIAEELCASGRRVFLSVGRAGRAPRRYRGKDIIEWLDLVGMFDLTPEQLPPGMGKFDGIPHLSGANGGHTLNLHQFARDGIKLLGHVRDIWITRLQIAPDLNESLAIVDQFENEVVTLIDEYVEKNNLKVPMEKLPQLKDGFAEAIITELDLMKEGIGTVVWATGYNFDYSTVNLPVFDKDGFPIQMNGVTSYPGLYFVGMPWMPTERSGFLLGVGESAKRIALLIEQRSKTPILKTVSDQP